MYSVLFAVPCMRRSLQQEVQQARGDFLSEATPTTQVQDNSKYSAGHPSPSASRGKGRGQTGKVHVHGFNYRDQHMLWCDCLLVIVMFMYM